MYLSVSGATMGLRVYVSIREWDNQELASMCFYIDFSQQGLTNVCFYLGVEQTGVCENVFLY